MYTRFSTNIQKADEMSSCSGAHMIRKKQKARKKEACPCFVCMHRERDPRTVKDHEYRRRHNDFVLQEMYNVQDNNMPNAVQGMEEDDDSEPYVLDEAGRALMEAYDSYFEGLDGYNDYVWVCMHDIFHESCARYTAHRCQMGCQ